MANRASGMVCRWPCFSQLFLLSQCQLYGEHDSGAPPSQDADLFAKNIMIWRYALPQALTGRVHFFVIFFMEGNHPCE
ncbi:MAG TPA: hypothetical protein DC013_06885 [Ruminococcaceae bacterium]|jgi:hypothetical protein|nr:hypothetical protein [Oscillospiraceae bacterium]